MRGMREVPEDKGQHQLTLLDLYLLGGKNISWGQTDISGDQGHSNTKMAASVQRASPYWAPKVIFYVSPFYRGT